MYTIIRKATAADFPAVVILIHEFANFQQTPDRVKITPADIEKDAGLFQCFVAETADKKIVGFASFFFAYYSWTGKAIYLDDLYVTDAHRKSGIGKKLLMTVIDLAKESNCKKVKWQVSKWNSNAIDFYKSIGAEVDDVEMNCNYTFK